MKIKFDSVLEETDKCVLIKVNDHVTWIPNAHAKFGHKWVEVSDWLHPRLIWVPDYTDINYVVTEDEARDIRHKLEESCWRKR
jgi:hypothetical protein